MQKITAFFILKKRFKIQTTRQYIDDLIIVKKQYEIILFPEAIAIVELTLSFRWISQDTKAMLHPITEVALVVLAIFPGEGAVAMALSSTKLSFILRSIKIFKQPSTVYLSLSSVALLDIAVRLLINANTIHFIAFPLSNVFLSLFIFQNTKLVLDTKFEEALELVTIFVIKDAKAMMFVILPLSNIFFIAFAFMYAKSISKPIFIIA